MAASRPRLSTPAGRRRFSRRPLPTGRPGVTMDDLVDLFASTRTSGGGSCLHLPWDPEDSRLATPQKCQTDMTAASFRTWRKSVEDCMKLERMGTGSRCPHSSELCPQTTANNRHQIHRRQMREPHPQTNPRPNQRVGHAVDKPSRPVEQLFQ